MKDFFCDWCETKLLRSELDSCGQIFVTNGDHYWCQQCWLQRIRSIKESLSSTEEEE
jgi:hypothetical protein